jgi:hypothetical protein
VDANLQVWTCLFHKQRTGVVVLGSGFLA